MSADMHSTERPLVSIVIPAYNAADYLREAIDSVLAQDYRPIELIVSDDGSTDETPDILRSYGNAFAWDRHDNCGQAETLNRAWAKSRGDILAYLSADDRLHPQAVRRSVEHLLGAPGTALVYCDFNLMDTASQVTRRVSSRPFERRALIGRLHCHPGPGAFFRRSAFERTGGWDPSFRQVPDLEFFFRLSLEGEFAWIPEVLADYRVHAESLTFAPSDPVRSQEPGRLVRKFFARADLPADVAALKRQAFGSADVLEARLHLRAGRTGAALHAWRRSLREDPFTALSSWAFAMARNAIAYRVSQAVKKKRLR